MGNQIDYHTYIYIYIYIYEDYRAITTHVTLFHFWENRNLKFEDFWAFYLLKFLNQTKFLSKYKGFLLSMYNIQYIKSYLLSIFFCWNKFCSCGHVLLLSCNSKNSLYWYAVHIVWYDVDDLRFFSFHSSVFRY